MSLTLRKRHVLVEIPTTWSGRMKAQAMRAGDRIAPMTDQAKVAAAHRIEDARYWVAPKLEGAAHRVEDQLAPMVSSMLSQAARRIDPTPVRSRRWPVMTLLAGMALGAVGYMFYRRNAQQWTDHMKDSASDASRWVSERAHQAAGKASSTSDRAADKVSSNADKAADKVDEATRKMS
ncbi:YtxH domain-containing protein [Nonomuraea sp. NPDC059194]|uniref:YtxH domain-containing protein n=1 Tax=Nonomuraea sp. NPDC059194 TaxID=3346764 RepID=UPI0036784576